MTDQKPRLDDLLREHKERFILEGQKTYILINGAGAAALLAFLQAIWTQDKAASLRVWVLCGIIAFACGVAVGSFSFLARHRALKKGQLDNGCWFQLSYIWIPIIAIVCFLVGLVLPVVGGFKAL